MDVQQKFLLQNLFKQKKVFVREKWCQRDDKVRKLLCWRNADKLWDYLSKNCWNFSSLNTQTPSQEIRCRVTITNESKKGSILFCLLHHNLQCLKNHILKLLNQNLPYIQILPLTFPTPLVQHFSRIPLNKVIFARKKTRADIHRSSLIVSFAFTIALL